MALLYNYSYSEAQHGGMTSWYSLQRHSAFHAQARINIIRQHFVTILVLSSQQLRGQTNKNRAVGLGQTWNAWEKYGKENGWALGKGTYAKQGMIEGAN